MGGWPVAVAVIALSLAWHVVGSQTGQRQVGKTKAKVYCPVFEPGNYVRWSYVKLYGKSYKDIATLKSSSGLYHDGFNHFYMGRLNISASDGSLIITNITSEDAGFYKCLSGTDPDDYSTPRFYTEELRLFPCQCEGQVGLTETKLDCPVFKPGNHVRWRYVKIYGESYKDIAALKSLSGLYYDSFNHTFKGRLNMSAADGSLLIRDITPEDAGFYKCLTKTDPDDYRTPLHYIVQLRLLPCQCYSLSTAAPATGHSSTDSMDHANKTEHPKGASNMKGLNIAGYVLLSIFVFSVIVIAPYIFIKKKLCKREHMIKAAPSSMVMTSGTYEDENQV